MNRIMIQPQNFLVFTPGKQEPNVASTTLSIHNPTAKPVSYKLKSNVGSALKCASSTGYIKPNGWASIELVWKKSCVDVKGLKVRVITEPLDGKFQEDQKEAYKGLSENHSGSSVHDLEGKWEDEKTETEKKDLAACKADCNECHDGKCMVVLPIVILAMTLLLAELLFNTRGIF